ncbi:MAG: prolyl-tRNA synthetase associated domain-containing protein [Filifactoraceae bacterium]
MLLKDDVFNKLKVLNIPFQVIEHPPVYTIEEMENFNITDHGNVVKNLFLRDQKGKRHFLVILNKDKQVDISKIKSQLGTTNLSFASEERLEKHLGLKKGSVSPLGIFNDPDGKVEVVIDKDLVGVEKLGIHPNDNTATVFLDYVHLENLIKSNGNKIYFIII